MQTGLPTALATWEAKSGNLFVQLLNWLPMFLCIHKVYYTSTRN